MIALYFWLGLFLIIGYFVVTDNSLATFLVLTQKRIKLEYEKLKWRITQSPDNPIVKYIIWKRSMKLAEKLRKELNEKNLIYDSCWWWYCRMYCCFNVKN
jgi:hypothetical protein